MLLTLPKREVPERDLKLMQKWSKQLLDNVDPRGPQEGQLRFNYTAGPRYDTSLQQYGLLGMWAAQQSGIALPAPPVLPALPLGQQVTRVVLDASILGAIPPGPLDAGLARWRDDGGTVEVRHIRLDWGPLSIQGDGTLALDAALQPLGAFSARAQGFFEAIDILRKQGQVDSQAANTARLVLGVMSRPSPGGGAPTIALPVSIQNRTVFAGPVAVARLNPIVWTGAMPVF